MSQINRDDLTMRLSNLRICVPINTPMFSLHCKKYSKHSKIK